MKNYELTDETKFVGGTVVHRIRALKDFRVVINPSGSSICTVKKGDLGGFVQSEFNLTQVNSAWVGGDAVVCGNAIVTQNALVLDNATIMGEAVVCGNATVTDHAVVSDNAIVCDDAYLAGNSFASEYAIVCGRSIVSGVSRLSGHVKIAGDSVVHSCELSDSRVGSGSLRFVRDAHNQSYA